MAAFRLPPDVIDNAILQAPNQTSLALMQELAKSMCISRATVWRRLTRFMAFAFKHLHWVPQRLTDGQR
jgi:hypothetical protein